MPSQPAQQELDYDQFEGLLPARLSAWNHTEKFDTQTGEKYTETLIRIGRIELLLGTANEIAIEPSESCSIADAHVVTRIGVGRGRLSIELGMMTVFVSYEAPYENINVREVDGPWNFLA